MSVLLNNIWIVCVQFVEVQVLQKKPAAVEERLHAGYARCSSLDRQVGEFPKLAKWCVTSELKVVEVECAHFMGD